MIRGMTTWPDYLAKLNVQMSADEPADTAVDGDDGEPDSDAEAKPKRSRRKAD